MLRSCLDCEPWDFGQVVWFNDYYVIHRGTWNVACPTMMKKEKDMGGVDVVIKQLLGKAEEAHLCRISQGQVGNRKASISTMLPMLM